MSGNYDRGMARAAQIAERYIIDGGSIHPDIPAAQMSEQARTIAHTTCQHIAEAIRNAKGDLSPLIGWEYLVTAIAPRRSAYGQDFNDWLNEYGEDGWELVIMEPRETSHDGLGRIVFKRVKSDG